MRVVPIPPDNMPLDPKTGRWKAPWISWLQRVSAPTDVYTVAGLPENTRPGLIVHASDGRKPGELAHAGTGCLVYADSSGAWISVHSGLAVTT